jgi:hypothetical protein
MLAGLYHIQGKRNMFVDENLRIAGLETKYLKYCERVGKGEGNPTVPSYRRFNTSFAWVLAMPSWQVY